VGGDREAQQDWLEIGRPPSRRPRWTARRPWLAALPVALTVMVAVVVAEGRLGDSAGDGGRPSAPATTSAHQQHQPFVEPPVVPPGPRVPDAAEWILYGRADVEVIRLDLGSGATTRTPVPRLDSAGPVTFLATGTRVVARPVQPVPGYQVPDGKAAAPLPVTLGQGALILPGPRPDQLWITSTSRYSTRDEMLLASLSTGRTRIQASLPVVRYGPVQPDGTGSYYFNSTGGSYLRVPGGYRRISTGTVLAAARTGWLTAECDGRLRCRNLLVDRRSGNRREVDLVPTFGVVTLVSLSPNSRYAVVAYRLGTQSPAFHLIDLTRGVDREVTTPFGLELTEGSLAWSPAGNYLAAIDKQGRLVVIASATARIVPLNVDLPPLVQLAAPSH
jgi:hypothetical protein